MIIPISLTNHGYIQKKLSSRQELVITKHLAIFYKEIIKVSGDESGPEELP